MKRFIILVVLLLLTLLSYKAYGQELCSAEGLENLCEKAGFKDTYYKCYHDDGKNCSRASKVWYTVKYDNCLLKQEEGFCRVWASFHESLCSFMCKHKKLPYEQAKAGGRAMCVYFWDEMMCHEREAKDE